MRKKLRLTLNSSSSSSSGRGGKGGEGGGEEVARVGGGQTAEGKLRGVSSSTKRQGAGLNVGPSLRGARLRKPTERARESAAREQEGREREAAIVKRGAKKESEQKKVKLGRGRERERRSKDGREKGAHPNSEIEGKVRWQLVPNAAILEQRQVTASACSLYRCFLLCWGLLSISLYLPFPRVVLGEDFFFFKGKRETEYRLRYQKIIGGKLSSKSPRFLNWLNFLV